MANSYQVTDPANWKMSTKGDPQDGLQNSQEVESLGSKDACERVARRRQEGRDRRQAEIGQAID